MACPDVVDSFTVGGRDNRSTHSTVWDDCSARKEHDHPPQCILRLFYKSRTVRNHNHTAGACARYLDRRTHGHSCATFSHQFCCSMSLDRYGGCTALNRSHHHPPVHVCKSCLLKGSQPWAMTVLNLRIAVSPDDPLLDQRDQDSASKGTILR